MLTGKTYASGTGDDAGGGESEDNVLKMFYKMFSGTLLLNTYVSDPRP